MNTLKIFSLMILFTVLTSLSGCNMWFSSHTNPFDISQIARKKSGSQVYIAGTVTRTIPLINYGAYQLQDATGTIWVLTNRNLPSVGNQISVKGQIKLQQFPVAQAQMYLQEIEVQNLPSQE